MTTEARERFTITDSSVRSGDRIIARLRYAGKVITVVRADRSVAGRLMPAGYAEGIDDASGLYDAWTAKHPMVHTPSDQKLGSGFTRDAGVEFLMMRRRASHAG